jgi:hypothetical protein
MIPIGFDPISSTLVISDNGVFPARSLTAFITPLMPDHVQINDLAGRGVQSVAWVEITSLDGTWLPTDMVGALAYLQSEFSKNRVIQTMTGIFTAASDLGGHRVVRVSTPDAVNLATCADPECASAPVGVTLGAAVAGSSILVATAGLVVEPSWTFDLGPVYLGLGGALTQIVPASGFILRIGTAIAPTRLMVELDEPYFLAA